MLGKLIAVGLRIGKMRVF